jgi:hypothetical protein
MVSNRSRNSVASPSGASSKVHRVVAPLQCLASNIRSRPGSTATTEHAVDQRMMPHLLVPRNRLPTNGSEAPSSQRPPVHSGLHRPIAVTSMSSVHRASAVARERNDVSPENCFIGTPTPNRGACGGPVDGMPPGAAIRRRPASPVSTAANRVASSSWRS